LRAEKLDQEIGDENFVKYAVVLLFAFLYFVISHVDREIAGPAFLHAVEPATIRLGWKLVGSSLTCR